MIEAYPLQWPIGYPRTKYPEKNYRFKSLNFGGLRDTLMRELRLMGAMDIVLSTNVPLKNDGLPYANFSKNAIEDHAVAVYFNINKEPMTLCCDKWSSIEVNIKAIVLSVQAMRGLDRWGVSEILKRVFTGFKAIPEQSSAKQWYEILGISKSSSKQEIISAYRNLVKIHHPDIGGSAIIFNEVCEAYQQGLKQAI